MLTQFGTLLTLLLAASCANLRPAPAHPGVKKYHLPGRWVSGPQTLFISCRGRFELDRHDDYNLKVKPRIGYLTTKPVMKHDVPSSKYHGEIIDVTDTSLVVDAIFDITFAFKTSPNDPSKIMLDDDVWQRVESFECD